MLKDTRALLFLWETYMIFWMFLNKWFGTSAFNTSSFGAFLITPLFSGLFVYQRVWVFFFRFFLFFILLTCTYDNQKNYHKYLGFQPSFLPLSSLLSLLLLYFDYRPVKMPKIIINIRLTAKQVLRYTFCLFYSSIVNRDSTCINIFIIKLLHWNSAPQIRNTYHITKIVIIMNLRE